MTAYTNRCWGVKFWGSSDASDASWHSTHSMHQHTQHAWNLIWLARLCPDAAASMCRRGQVWAGAGVGSSTEGPAEGFSFAKTLSSHGPMQQHLWPPHGSSPQGAWDAQMVPPAGEGKQGDRVFS